MRLHEFLKLAEEDIRSSDQPQVAHDGTRKEPDHVLVAGREGRIHRGDVALLIGVQVAKDDFALLILGEHAVGHALVAKRGHVKIGKILVFALDTGRKQRQLDI